MNEKTPKETSFDTPRQAYDYFFKQIMNLPTEVKEGVFLSQDEIMTVSPSHNSMTISFDTTKLNISKPDEPEGAYDNTFTFLFTQDMMSLSYLEAVPVRLQTAELRISNYEDVDEFLRELLPFIKKLNQLFSYFGLSYQLKFSN